MKTDGKNIKKLYYKNISNMIDFNNWLKENIPLYESYDDDEMVPMSHVKQYLIYLKDLVTKNSKGKKVFKRKEWEDQIDKLIEDKIGERLGR